MSKSIYVDMSVVQALQEIADVILKYPYSAPMLRDLAVKLQERAREIVEEPLRRQSQSDKLSNEQRRARLYGE